MTAQLYEHACKIRRGHWKAAIDSAEQEAQRENAFGVHSDRPIPGNKRSIRQHARKRDHSGRTKRVMLKDGGILILPASSVFLYPVLEGRRVHNFDGLSEADFVRLLETFGVSDDYTIGSDRTLPQSEDLIHQLVLQMQNFSKSSPQPATNYKLAS